MIKQLCGLAVLTGAVGIASAPAQLVWTGNVNNAWDTTSANWLNGGIPATYADNNNVLFNDSALQATVNVVAPVTPSSVIVTNSSATFIFTNSSVNGNGWLRKEGGGTLILSASNAFTGSFTINGGRVITRVAGALGSGSVLFNRSSINGAILQLEVPYQVLSNDITVTGQVGTVTLNTLSPMTLQADLTSYGTNTLNIMSSNSSSALMVFNQAAAGKAVMLATGSRINQDYGLFDPVVAANLPTNAGYRQNASGMIVLSPGFSWGNLVGGRTWTNSATPGGFQWMGRNFAGRGSTQVIDGTGAFQAGATNTWLSSGFGILMGSSVTNADGSFYANAGVKIIRDIFISGDYPVTVASTGPGFTNDSSVGIIQELAGTISGTGAVRLLAAGTGSEGQLPELVLSGNSVWTGRISEFWHLPDLTG
jgi:autotransporter-associated beta strand protein